MTTKKNILDKKQVKKYGVFMLCSVIVLLLLISGVRIYHHRSVEYHAEHTRLMHAEHQPNIKMTSHKAIKK